MALTIKSQYVGRWRITGMSTWGRDYLDLVAPAHLTIRKNGTGQFRFGAVAAELDCRVERIGESEQVAFSFVGWDEGDDVSGRGWATVAGNKLNGWLGFHCGDCSTFLAEKKRQGAAL